MRHVHRLSAGRADWLGASEEAANACILGGTPVLADAKTDLLAALNRAWSDYLYAKKNEPIG